jgi:N,N'-diacetyllegionaminate synthase
MTQTLIIAEAGVNHNGDMGLARQLIDAAADAGADAVKFQTFIADNLVTRAARKADYQVDRLMVAESQHTMLRRLELTRAMHEELIAHCTKRGIEFFSTAFDGDSIQLLSDLGLTTFKIPSGEITNLPYIRQIGKRGGRVLLSTGMATLGEVESAIDALERAGTSRDSITVLHCTTEYPTPMHDVNLRAMCSIRDAFAVTVGYSDHTPGVEVAIAAVALGATVIEKHFTMDRRLPGPDHKASLEPAELKAMVTAIRNVEVSLGDGVKRVSAVEERNKVSARKSIVAALPIKKGDLFSTGNLTVKRPGTGLSPMLWDVIVGRTAARDFVVDETIDL